MCAGIAMKKKKTCKSDLYKYNQIGVSAICNAFHFQFLTWSVRLVCIIHLFYGRVLLQSIILCCDWK